MNPGEDAIIAQLGHLTGQREVLPGPLDVGVQRKIEAHFTTQLIVARRPTAWSTEETARCRVCGNEIVLRISSRRQVVIKRAAGALTCVACVTFLILAYRDVIPISGSVGWLVVFAIFGFFWGLYWLFADEVEYGLGIEILDTSGAGGHKLFRPKKDPGMK